MKKGYFYGLGKAILPEKIRLGIKRYILKTGRAEVPFNTYGLAFFFSLVFTIVIYGFFFFKMFKTTNLVLFFIRTFLFLVVTELVLVALLMIGFYLYYEFVIFRRTLMIEEVLPDFLEEVAINLRAGMGFDKALWNSIEPEFGILEKEIQIVAKKVMAGEDTEEALREFSLKYNSLLLQESMDMLIIGLKSGGNIADLIEKIVENIKAASFLRKELIASVMSYIIFIMITAIVISPALFALSYNLMLVVQSLGEKIASSSYSMPSLSITFKSIKADDFILFSKLCIVIISTISSMIIADLREGSIKAGIKYIFISVPASYLIYIVLLEIFKGFFGNIA